MKSFFSIFKSSAQELKRTRCITVTGILIAAFIVLDICSINIGGFIKINFNFIAIAAVGMLFGPVPAMMAGIAGDLIGCILSGYSPIPLLTCTAALTGLIYGVCLYKKDGMRLVIFSIISRLIDSVLVSFLLNTAILMYAGQLSKTREQLYLRYGSTAAQLVFFIPLIMAVMPSIKIIYEKIVRHKPEM